MSKISSNYMHLLSTLGLHIGQHTSHPYTDGYVYQYLLGSRAGFYIFNLNASIFLLKRALSFVETLSSINPYNSLCFYHSDSNDNVLIMSLLANVQYNTQQAVVLTKWVNGLFTNWNQMTYSMVKPLFSKRKERFNYGFQVILAKMIFILMQRSLRLDELDFYKKYSLFSRFWKFLLLFQFFVHLKKIPSSLFFFGSLDSNLPILECNVINTPVISVLDSNMSSSGITYPIPGNGDSVLLVSLLLNLLSNAYNRGKYKFYATHKLLYKVN